CARYRRGDPAERPEWLFALDGADQPEPISGELASDPRAGRQPHHVLADRAGSARQEDPARERSYGPRGWLYDADGPDADYHRFRCRQLDRRRLRSRRTV